jgi:8-oxo-dGTP pyrophosphatase MutT (NUDIX family)
MGAHTANAGKIYFPSGTPDPRDVSGGRVDLEKSLARELQEETGLDAGAFAAEPGWRIVEVPSRLVAVKVLRAPLDAAALKARVAAHLARENEPELRALHMVRDSAGLTAAMPDFVHALFEDLWR